VCQDDRGLRPTGLAVDENGARMGRKLGRRLATTGIAAMAVLALTAGPASAHFCFKTNLNERAAQGQAGSANWVSFNDLASEFSLGYATRASRSSRRQAEPPRIP
jgi:hypothetical protein